MIVHVFIYHDSDNDTMTRVFTDLDDAYKAAHDLAVILNDMHDWGFAEIPTGKALVEGEWCELTGADEYMEIVPSLLRTNTDQVWR